MLSTYPTRKKAKKLSYLLEGEHDAQALKQQLMNAGMPTLLLSASILSVKNVPMLGSGKTDFAISRQLATELLTRKDKTARVAC